MMRLRSFVAVAVIAGLGIVPMGQVAPAGSGDAAYTALAKSYFDASFKLNPSSATSTGVHDYDTQLGDFSAAAFRRALTADHDWLAKLGAIDRTTLSPEVKVDATLLEYALKDDLLLNETLGQWQHNPDIYTGTASGAIFVLMGREFAPAATRLRDVIAREKAIPAMLQDARKNTTTVDKVTQEIAVDDATGAVDFFKTSVPEAFTTVKDPALRAQFAKANAAVIAAMGRYAHWIKTIKPSGTYAIGADAYKKRLLYEDGLDISLPAYLAIGEKALEQTRAQFIAVAKKINPKASPLAVYLSITKVHPKPGALLGVAQNDLNRLRAFIVKKQLITLPADANIKVIDTPAFERATTEAAEDSAGPLEKVATQAYYYVTPVDPKWSKSAQEEFLEQFNDYEFPIISAHEVYPGHFTNFAIDRHLPLSLTRQMLGSSVFAEGWAHYSEQMMVDEGWGNGDPKVRLAQLEEAMLRNCRYVVGVGLHTGGMTITQAQKQFTDRCFQPQQVAVGETLRGTQDPMYGYYTLGKLMNLKLRADFRKKLGAAYTLKKFHDALLAHGDPPQPLLRPLILGADDDGNPL